MLISNVISKSKKKVFFQKNSLIRVPIRLGEDSFTSGSISDRNLMRLINAINAFKSIMNVHNVTYYKAYATSALREATNKSYIVKKVFENCKIKIEIIDGTKEAKIISKSNISTIISPDTVFLSIDVGGGSTEFSVMKKGKIISSRSFRLGTIRLLNNAVSNQVWEEVRNWIDKKTNSYNKITLLGSGGNINKIFSLSKTKEGKPLSRITFNKIFKQLESVSYFDRMINYSLNPDRADVILPASRIFLKAFEWTSASKIYVPRVGLSDGIIKDIYDDLNKEELNSGFL
ncbi:MAG: exopolyphosphatase [Flavobacteriaceae bacterium]|nr:exopolyphosphatase [Flavobacteriaceae bacterium]